jgi:pyrrolysine biosynthesis protein PylC
VAGGGLQGTEAAYLAGKAGWETILIDMRGMVPASGLCDHFVRMDLVEEGTVLEHLMEQADLVVPALENQLALRHLEQAAKNVGVPLAHDAAAYAITCSKQISDALFAARGIPAPRYWPDCGMPVIAKPSDSSGSKGVRLLKNPGEIKQLMADALNKSEQWVIQEYLPGDSYSIEIMGLAGHYLPLQVTDLGMDADYDCRCVTAPTKLPPGKIAEFKALAVRIAKLINLKGIMDIEVIDHNGVLKVLEIDARLPSQTPVTVYNSSRVNMLKMLYDIFVKHKLPAALPGRDPRAVIYEHILVTQGRLVLLGEHVIAAAGPLRLIPDFYGADEAMTNYAPATDSWTATLIFKADRISKAYERRRETLAAICRQYRLPLPELSADELYEKTC